MGWLSKQLGSVGKRLGFDQPSAGDLRSQSENARAAEMLRLEAEERKRRREAVFLETEGEGKRRTAKLSFGNEAALDAEDPDTRSRRALGRFDEERLIL